MKQSCIFYLVVLAAAWAGYHYLFLGTELQAQYWLPGVLALGVVGLLANIQGILQAMRQRRASNKPRRDWQDGELVGISGRIQAVRSPIAAPFSGESAVIVEYDILRERTGDGSQNTFSDYSGFLMTPCTVQSRQGAVKLVGFPLLAQMKHQDFKDEKAYARAAQYLSKCTFKSKSGSISGLLGELNKVLTDDDGDVRADFCTKTAGAHITLSKADWEELGDEEEEAAESGLDPVAIIARRLFTSGYTLRETKIKNGAEVTAFGSYRSNRQAIDIGSGFKNLAHSIQLGSYAEVSGRIMRKAVISSLVWAAIVGAGNWYVLKLIGIELQ